MVRIRGSGRLYLHAPETIEVLLAEQRVDAFDRAWRAMFWETLGCSVPEACVTEGLMSTSWSNRAHGFH